MLTLFNSTEMALKTNLNSSENSNLMFWTSDSGEEKIQAITNDIELPAWGTMIIRVESQP